MMESEVRSSVTAENIETTNDTNNNVMENENDNKRSRSSDSSYTINEDGIAVDVNGEPIPKWKLWMLVSIVYLQFVCFFRMYFMIYIYIASI